MSLFQERHGLGSYQQLLELLGQPCVSFAAIAARFHVSRELVRQWHRSLLSDAPSGHDRRRQCVSYQRKRRVFADALFKEFYQHARRHVARDQIELIGSSHGYRLRQVTIRGRSVAIRDASRSTSRGSSSGAIHTLTPGRSRAEFVYFALNETDFLLVPARVLPASGTTFSAGGHSKYERYRNTFDTLLHSRSSAAPAVTDCSTSVDGWPNSSCCRIGSASGNGTGASDDA